MNEFTSTSLAIGAITNMLWLEYVHPILQGVILIGGIIFLYYNIRQKRADWLLKRKELMKDNEG